MPKVQTDGIGVAAKVGADANTILLSLSGTNTHTIVPTLSDAAGTAKTIVAAHKFVSRNPYVATVTAGGIVTGVHKGQVTVEVSYPAFDNSHGLASDGTHAEKVYQEITVTVRA